ncbi:uncharacterized protein LOC129800699 [Phlebotomus papatasi]|uniref:uncharacterized protein LOC129800699 n=1 Tax=Phlebotomus papatasi TaxID=29031 RepID=UPI0024841E57|nr:uncharacterized protein LOC129800699 [Phlebotomus papatasi]
MFHLKFPKKLLCFELKIGAIIIGWCHLLLSIAGIISALILLGNIQLQTETVDYVFSIYNGTTLIWFEEQTATDVRGWLEKSSTGTYLCTCIGNFVAASLLIYGSMKENHLLLLPWLTSEMMGILLLTFTMFFDFIELVIVVLLRVYIWICIWAFYREIKKNKQVTGYPEPPVIFRTNVDNPKKPPPYGNVVTVK